VNLSLSVGPEFPILHLGDIGSRSEECAPVDLTGGNELN